jgi:hypothetical protein
MPEAPRWIDDDRFLIELLVLKVIVPHPQYRQCDQRTKAAGQIADSSRQRQRRSFTRSERDLV